MRGVGGGGPADTEPVEVDSVAGHVLLGLEHDDVDLGSEHAAQHHEATQTDRYAHGGRLNLEDRAKTAVYRAATRPGWKREFERLPPSMLPLSFPCFPQH